MPVVLFHFGFLNYVPLRAEIGLEGIGKTFGERVRSRNIIRGLFEKKEDHKTQGLCSWEKLSLNLGL